MNFLRTMSAALCVVLGFSVNADDLLIRSATVHTMGPQGTLEATDVLVSGTTIQAIGIDLDAPDGARVIEADGRDLTPGLFAGITAIGIGEVSAVTESMDAVSSLADMRPEFDVSLAYNPNSSLLPVNRVEGVTFTVLGAGAGGNLMGGRGRVATLDGGYDSLFGPRPLFIALGRNASLLSGGSRAAQWMLLQQAFDEADTAPRGTEPAVLTRTGRSVLARYADGGTVVFSVNRAADILRTLAFAKSNGLEAVIDGGAEAWMVADQLAEAGVPVLLNPLANLPANFDALGSRMDNAALLDRAGVTIAIDGAGSHNARKQRQLAGNAVSYGLDHARGLAALTINPARIFGVDDRLGSLARGKRADLVLWSGDPLEVTTVADLVVSNGKVDSMQSRQTRLRDRYLVEDPELPRAYVK